MGELERESPAAQQADHRVHVRERDGGRGGAGFHHPRRPRVAEQGAAGGQDPLAHRRLPVGVGAGRVDLADDDVDQAVEQFLLVAHVAVERHRHDVESLRQLPHAEGLDASTIGQVDGSAKHALPRERRPRRGPCVDLGAHPLTLLTVRLDKCTAYTYALPSQCTAYTSRDAGANMSGGNPDESDHAGPLRLDRCARVQGRRPAASGREGRARAGQGGGCRHRRLARHGRQALPAPRHRLRTAQAQRARSRP